jgi:hypothetical protein
MGLSALRGAHEAEHARCVLARIHVAHDGAGDHLAASGAERLDHADHHEQADARGQRAGEAGRRVEAEPGEEDAPAAEAVGERAPDELGRRQAGQEQRDGELGGGGVGAVEGGERGQRGQEHVDGQGSQPHHRGEEDGDPAEPGGRRAAHERRISHGSPIRRWPARKIEPITSPNHQKSRFRMNPHA